MEVQQNTTTRALQVETEYGMMDPEAEKHLRERHEDYKSKRQVLCQELRNCKYGNMHISEDDQRLNGLFSDVLSGVRMDFPEDFYCKLAMEYKDDIKKHPLFRHFETMPKGAILHHHLADCINKEWIQGMVEQYQENIYERDFSKELAKKNILSFWPKSLVFTKRPNISTHSLVREDKPFAQLFEGWKNENSGKNKNKNLADFWIEKLSMLPSDLATVKNSSGCWDLFMPRCLFALPLLTYKEFYREHLNQVFKECIQEKVYRLETRLTPGWLRNENGEMEDQDNNPIIPLEEEMDLYNECVQKARQVEPLFSFGIIVEMYRSHPMTKIAQTMEQAYALKKKYPELIVGMDIDGYEDGNKRFKTFKELSQLMLRTEEFSKKYGVKIPWILHCGESIKMSNQNPIDGCLLEARRFGHGINVVQHGAILDKIKQKDICIEVNPISNQTLKQVYDLRTHPAKTYLNYGIKICISNDNTQFNTSGMAYDYFVACLCFELDLLDLKKICLNSIDASELPLDLEASRDKSVTKEALKTKFNQDWEQWIHQLEPTLQQLNEEQKQKEKAKEEQENQRELEIKKKIEDILAQS
jgi:adenosine deaminase CECR1